MIDSDLVRSRCQEIMDSVERIRKIKMLPLKVFLKDQDQQDIGCYRLQIAIEAALSLCYHITAKELRKVPDEYAQCFALLEEAGIITVDLSGNLQKMARFRNLLVHMYWKIDYTAVYDIINNNTDDLEEFCRQVVDLI